MNERQKILRHFKKNKGFLLVDEIESIDFYTIKKMLKNNEIQRLKKGVYTLNHQETYDERVLVSKMYPNAVFCLYSAFDFHELTTSLPSKHNIVLGRNTKISAPKFPPIQVYYWSDKSYQLGIQEVIVDNSKIKIYDLEKTVCDAIKYRGKIGEYITLEVVKNYVSLKNKDFKKLMQYSKLLRIEKITEQYIKPLL